MSDTSTTQQPHSADNIISLRSVLFDTIRDLRAGTTDVKTAQAVSGLAQALINTARVELDYRKLTGASTPSGFIDANEQLTAAQTPAHSKESVGPGHTRYRIKG
jgi:hypothetical protein